MSRFSTESVVKASPRRAVLSASIGSGLFCFAFKTADGIRSLFQAKFKVCYVVKGALQSRFNPFMQDTFEHSLPVAH